MKLLTTFFTDHFSVLRDHWRKGDIGKKDGCYLVVEHQPLDLGGRIAILDWEKKMIEYEREVRTPFGVAEHDGVIYVTTGDDNWHSIGDGSSIRKYDGKLQQLGVISNQCMNDSHGMSIAPDGTIWLASTGLDLILGMDMQGNTKHTWYATEHGFTHDLTGNVRRISKQMDHRRSVYMTPFQTTHLNTVFEQDDYLYATLWAQGQVIKISKESGEHSVVVDGLCYPHSFLPTNDGGYLVSDTRYKYPDEAKSLTHYGRVVIFDDAFRQKAIIEDDFCWVQDARHVRHRNEDFIAVADSNNNRICLYDLNRKKVDQWVFDKEWKIGTITPLMKK
jgi:hypothetical protein